MNVTSLVKTIQTAAKHHTPEILTGIGLAGMLTTVVLAVKATPKAIKKIEEKKEELEVEKLKPQETVKAAWACYVPATMVGVASAACIVGASSVHLRRNAALAAAYSFSTATAKEYKEKVKEIVGEKKEKEVRDSIAGDHIQKNPMPKGDVFIAGQGDMKCYDVLSDRYFPSNINKIKGIVNDLNMQMRNENYISLNDFYYELGLNGLHDVGDNIGWDINKGLYIEIDYSSHLDENGVPCLAISHVNAPQYIE